VLLQHVIAAKQASRPTCCGSRCTGWTSSSRVLARRAPGPVLGSGCHRPDPRRAARSARHGRARGAGRGPGAHRREVAARAHAGGGVPGPGPALGHARHRGWNKALAAAGAPAKGARRRSSSRSS
jgi:hypothetical protein